MRALLFTRNTGNRLEESRNYAINPRPYRIRQWGTYTLIAGSVFVICAVLIAGVNVLVRQDTKAGIIRSQVLAHVSARKSRLPIKSAFQSQKHIAGNSDTSNISSTVYVGSSTSSSSVHSDVTVNGQKISVPANGTYSHTTGNSSVTVTRSELLSGNDSAVSLNVQSVQQSGGNE